MTITHKNAIKGAIGLGLSLFSVTSLAQFAAYRESTFRPSKFSVEVKPLPMALSTVPGVASLGIGTELSAGGNATTFADVYVINANLPTGLRAENRENEVPVVQKMEGYAADLGFRYYANPAGIDSWYGGAKLSYSLAKGQWGYQGEKIDHAVRTLSPGLEGGYRWQWANNFLLRLGAGADGNIVQENTTSAVDRSTAVTTDAEDKVQGYAQAAVTPRLDMGLGYAF